MLSVPGVQDQGGDLVLRPPQVEEQLVQDAQQLHSESATVPAVSQGSVDLLILFSVYFSVQFVHSVITF